MLFAIVNGEKVEATPNLKGVCPSCKNQVFSRCGEINVWHWSHHTDENCETWYEPETEWHKNWKLIFGKEKCEIVIKIEGVRHIADILTSESIVIELQNSPIDKATVRRREEFYGERMIWIINGIYFKENFNIYYPKLDAEWEYYTQNNPLYKGRKAPKKIEHLFSWKWPRKCWDNNSRPIFIDFGDENLIWVKSGMGSSSGECTIVKKGVFLEKYGGNTDLVKTLIRKVK